MKSGNLNFLEHSGPLQACNGTDFLLSNKRHDFRKCFFFFISLRRLSETFLTLRRTERDMIKKKCVIVLMYSNPYFLDIFSKNTPISNFMEIRPVGGEFSHADRRTDNTMLIVAFRSTANASTSGWSRVLRLAY